MQRDLPYEPVQVFLGVVGRRNDGLIRDSDVFLRAFDRRAALPLVFLRELQIAGRILLQLLLRKRLILLVRFSVVETRLQFSRVLLIEAFLQNI